MRILHTSDWHLGRRLMSVDMHEHHAEFLAWLLRTAQAEQVDLVVVAGDIFDRSQPSAESVDLLDRTLASFAAAGVRMLLIPGNHDHPVRIGYGRALFEQSGIHVRATVSDISAPVVLSDEAGPVACYGIPYLAPDAVMAQLEAERSHASVLDAAMQRVRADAAARGIDRIVVAAHAFVVGQSASAESDSERDISVGGVPHVPVSVFDGADYVALGHLHGCQRVRDGREAPAESSEGVRRPVVRYSGSPLPFSFSERNHVKSVLVTDLDAAGEVTVREIAAPVPRPLRQVTGTLAELLELAEADQSGLENAWVKAVLTDRIRPESPMERLRQVWPHAIALDFAPAGRGERPATAALGTPAEAANAADIIGKFIAQVLGEGPDEATQVLIENVLEDVRVSEEVA